MRHRRQHHPETESLHHRVNNAETHPIVTPIYQNSAFSAESPYFYTRKANPNSVELEGALAVLENAKHVISTTTGMAAISLVLQQLRPGDHLVVSRFIYGCSYKLFQRHAAQYNLELSFLDLSDPDEIARIPDNVSMVILETPTNPFLKTVPIHAVSQATHTRNPNALVVVDNTWATPIFQNPLQSGADISLASATKYISGHSDVMGGMVAVNSDVLAETLRMTRFYTGAILDPNSAWLLRRSLHTLPLRMREHVRTTRILTAFLDTRPEIKAIHRPDINPDQLRDYGGIIFFEFAEELKDRYTNFVQNLQLFDTGTGMACVSSMVAQPWSGSHASLETEEKVGMGLHQGVVRLCFGLENPDDLITDITEALEALHHG